MFQPLNEFKYTAENGKDYIIYFLKFWQAADKKGDYVVKYQIRAPERDFVWYARMSLERFKKDTNLSAKELKSLSKQALEERVANHLKTLFTYVMRKGLSKGFEEPNIEFVFYIEPPIARRVWQE